MQFLTKNKIKLDKELNELDKFVIEFVRILEKHTDYVIISGYVSILFGRSRSSEDVDIFIPRMDVKEFFDLFNSLEKSPFWCINTSKKEEAYSYLGDGLALRFAKKNTAVPNMEVKFAMDALAQETLKDRIEVVVKAAKLFVSSLEMQIAFKRYHLKSDKDVEDAAHLEEVFREYIDAKKIEYYKRRIENEKTGSWKNQPRR